VKTRDLENRKNTRSGAKTLAQGVADKKSVLGNTGHVSSGISVGSSKIIGVLKGCKDSEMKRDVVRDVLLIGNSSNIIGHQRTGKPTDLIKGTRITTKRSSKKDSEIYVRLQDLCSGKINCRCTRR
jgi:hypothetical protein